MKRTRYQFGSLECKARSNSPDVWVLRFYRMQPDGTKSYASQMIGTVDQYPTRPLAWKAAEALRLEANPDNPSAQAITFGALIERYMTEAIPERFSTRKAYTAYLRKHIKPKWRDYRICDVKPFAVSEWLKSRVLAPKSKVHIRNLMRILFDYAMLWELVQVADNPMRLVKVKDASKREEEPIVLTQEQFHRLLQHIPDEPFKTMVLTAMCLGLRCSELLGLKWSDFDWENLTLLVQRAVVDGHVDKVKTKYSKTRVPLDPGLGEVLLNWKLKSQFNRTTDWVFASPFSAGEMPYQSWGIQQRRLKPAAIQAGIGEIGWHTFRHTYRSWLDETGAPMKVQQELMRHADIRTTMNIYGAAMSESKRQANSKIVQMALNSRRKGA